MGQAYTPGLKVTDRMVLRKDRILPLKGKIKVKKGIRLRLKISLLLRICRERWNLLML